MVDENAFINKLKKYDNTGLEFDSIENMNDIIKGTMRPIKKRGLNENEFTYINLNGFEVINDDVVLDHFNVIPPGPKTLERHRTHLIVGRYSQSIMPIILVRINNKGYVLIQKRHPLNFGTEESIELYRDYIGTVDKFKTIEEYVAVVFKELADLCKNNENKQFGYYWENTGIVSAALNIGLFDFEINDSSLEIDDVTKLFKSERLLNPQNIIGVRTLDFVAIDTLISRYKHIILEPLKTKSEHYVNDLLSMTGIFWLTKYLDSTKKLNKRDESVTSVVE